MKSISVRVSRDEYETWVGHAQTRGIPVAEWVYRAVRLVLEADLPGTTTITGRPKRLLSRAVKCHWCGAGFEGAATRRRRYCSDVCRVRAWRARTRSSA